MKEIEEYTIQELEEILLGIDENKFPEKYSEVKSELSIKLKMVSELEEKISRLKGNLVVPIGGDLSSDPYSLKQLFLLCCCSIGLLWVILGVLGLFGLSTVSVNGNHVFGFKALIAGLISGAISSALLALMVWVGAKVHRLTLSA